MPEAFPIFQAVYRIMTLQPHQGEIMKHLWEPVKFKAPFKLGESALCLNFLQ